MGICWAWTSVARRPGSSSSSVLVMLLCVDLADGEEPPAAIFAVRGFEQLCKRLVDAGVSVTRSSEEGVGDYVIVHDPDGHELLLEPTEA
jgi:hypothetical protein